FVSKHNTPYFRPSCPSLGTMKSTRSMDLLLCPVRAYNIYLDRTTHWLDEVPLAHRHRFLWTLQDPTRSPSIRVLSECFKSLVKDARHLNGIFSQVQIGPHQMRKLSASYADQVGQEETRVMRIMGFSSLSILRKNYVAWVPPLQVPCVLPGGTFLPQTDHQMSDSD
ncbi:unnamed protein product, partial [Meganyctiphanes norvegica]